MTTLGKLERKEKLKKIAAFLVIGGVLAFTLSPNLQDNLVRDVKIIIKHPSYIFEEDGIENYKKIQDKVHAEYEAKRLAQEQNKATEEANQGNKVSVHQNIAKDSIKVMSKNKNSVTTDKKDIEKIADTITKDPEVKEKIVQQVPEVEHVMGGQVNEDSAQAVQNMKELKERMEKIRNSNENSDASPKMKIN